MFEFITNILYIVVGTICVSFIVSQFIVAMRSDKEHQARFVKNEKIAEEHDERLKKLEDAVAHSLVNSWGNKKEP